MHFSLKIYPKKKIISFKKKKQNKTQWGYKYKSNPGWQQFVSGNGELPCWKTLSVGSVPQAARGGGTLASPLPAGRGCSVLTASAYVQSQHHEPLTVVQTQVSVQVS